ncbi:flagellar filament capping protein FliD [Thiolapillus brandeum]|uniref:Flagellar hook-associated protein 2 n=1 Tax=Thiolapillus brandeum TaxID=1076588 RepID=A0A7U6GIJ5_9GAMM|nr:flagellar filament capping protein FliD [Thiolapillus brandeum]BAO44299.1 flagellar hook-associated protein 2 [Thiolapillus brandeum]
MITAPGVGSGLDVQSIVSQLMALERRPLEALARRQDQYEAQLSAYGQLNSALSSFQDAMEALGTTDSFKVYAATSADESALKVSANSNASLGTYNVRVERLASNHKMASAEFLDTTTFGGNAGDGLTIQVGDTAANAVSIDLSTAATMEEIRDLVNEDPGNPGVTATIIDGNNGNQKLVLTSDETGTASAITLSYAGTIDAATFGMQTLNDIGGDLSLLDSRISVDGYDITRSGNTLTDVIQGVSLDLQAARPGVDIQIKVERDTSSVKESVQGFADAYNDLRTSIRSLREGQLEADSTLLSIERGLLGILNNPTGGGAFTHLTEIGVSLQKDGTMSVNSSSIDDALNSDYSAVADLFANSENGYAVRLGALAGTWLEDGGLIESRTDGLDSRIEDLQDRQIAMDRRLSQVEARYLKQFSSLDSLMSQLQGTSSFLTSQLASLPGAGTR